MSSPILFLTCLTFVFMVTQVLQDVSSDTIDWAKVELAFQWDGCAWLLPGGYLADAATGLHFKFLRWNTCSHKLVKVMNCTLMVQLE